MKHLVLFIVIISFSLLIWGCSEEVQSPTASMDSEESMAMEEDELQTESHMGGYGSIVEYEVML